MFRLVMEVARGLLGGVVIFLVLDGLSLYSRVPRFGFGCCLYIAGAWLLAEVLAWMIPRAWAGFKKYRFNRDYKLLMEGRYDRPKSRNRISWLNLWRIGREWKYLIWDAENRTTRVGPGGEFGVKRRYYEDEEYDRGAGDDDRTYD